MPVAALGHKRAKTHRCDDGQTALGSGLERDFHLGQMKKRFDNEEVDAGVLEQTNLFADVIAGFGQRVRSLALDELSARNAAGDQRAMPSNVFGQLYGREIDLLDLGA